jgi:hypothetical protein
MQLSHFRTYNYLDPRTHRNVSSQLLLNFQKTVQALDADQLWQWI